LTAAAAGDNAVVAAVFTPYRMYMNTLYCVCVCACMQVERLFALCRRYNLKVLLDIHAVQGSQNGFDNSGRTMNLEWTTFSSNKVNSN
jgi:hypothetical protein